MRKVNTKLNKTHLIIAVMIIAINCAAVVGVLSAKYVKDFFPIGELMLSVELNEKINIIEHKAQKQPDGSYKLNAEQVTSNTYSVMPGVDIPKDPQIILENKTAVPGYLYVEIVESIPNTVEYELMPNWIRLGTVIGPKGGEVYVYSIDGTTESIIDDTVFPTEIQIPIIKNNILRVSDTAGPVAADDKFEMDVHGYIAQVVKTGGVNKNAEETFKEVFMTPTP